MKVDVKVQEVKLGQLNTECVMLTSKFARVLKDHNGKQLKMQHPSVLSTIERYAIGTRNEELKEIFSELKAGIIVSMYKSQMHKSRMLSA